MSATAEREPSKDAGHASLVAALARLPEAERRKVIADAVQQARGRTTVDWDSLRAACGVVSLGGNAVEDCHRLYDG